MCELTKSEYEQDCKPLMPMRRDDDMRNVDVMAQTMRSIDDFFGPSLQRARDLADKIHRVALDNLAVDAEDADQDPWTTQP